MCCVQRLNCRILDLIRTKKKGKHMQLFLRSFEQNGFARSATDEKEIIGKINGHCHSDMRCSERFGTICTILKNVRNTHGGVILSVQLC